MRVAILASVNSDDDDYVWEMCIQPGCQAESDVDLSALDRGDDHNKHKSSTTRSTTPKMTKQSTTTMRHYDNKSTTTPRYRYDDDDDDDDDDDEVAWWGILIGVLAAVAVIVVVVVSSVCLCKRKKSRVASSTPSVKQFSNFAASPPAYTISDGRCDKVTTKEAPPPYEIDIPPPAYIDQKAIPVTPSCPRSPVLPLDDTFKVVPLD